MSATYIGQATEGPYSGATPENLPVQARQSAEAVKDALFQLLLDNMQWFFALLALYMAVSFGKALIAWYRNRKEAQEA